MNHFLNDQKNFHYFFPNIFSAWGLQKTNCRLSFYRKWGKVDLFIKIRKCFFELFVLPALDPPTWTLLTRPKARCGICISCILPSTFLQIVEPGTPVKEGQIRDCNRTTLIAACKQQGFRVVDLGIAEDRWGSVCCLKCFFIVHISDLTIYDGNNNLQRFVSEWVLWKISWWKESKWQTLSLHQAGFQWAKRQVFYNKRVFKCSLFSCAERNANELEQRILLIYIRFGTWEERRLKRALEEKAKTIIWIKFSCRSSDLCA